MIHIDNAYAFGHVGVFLGGGGGALTLTYNIWWVLINSAFGLMKMNERQSSARTQMDKWTD